jgi:hypothetical protein
VNKGTKKKGDEKFTVGDAIEGGLTSDLFKNATAEKGVLCAITTEKDIVTQILVTKGKKKAD